MNIRQYIKAIEKQQELLVFKNQFLEKKCKAVPPENTNIVSI